MGTIRDVARLGKTATKDTGTSAEGLLWFIYIFGGIFLFFFILNKWLNYKIKKRMK
jgi:hypothetical protein